MKLVKRASNQRVIVGGRYRHFKGGLYVVVGIAFDHTDGRSVIYTKDDAFGELMFVQPECRFCGNAGEVSRFTYEGPHVDVLAIKAAYDNYAQAVQSFKKKGSDE